MSDRNQIVFLLLNSAAAFYTALANLPMARDQVAVSTAWWAPAMLAFFLAVPALTTTLASLGYIATRLNLPGQRALLAAARSAGWLSAYAVLIMSVWAVGAHLITGVPLYTRFPSAHVWAPFPLMLAAPAVIYPVILRSHLALHLLVAHTVLGVPFGVSVGLRPGEALADSLYSMVFSGVFIGVSHALLTGLADLEQSTSKTIADRLATFELNARLEERTQVNALLHDYIIAVTVVVGRNLEVGRHAVKAAAREALEVLDRMMSDAPLYAPIPAEPEAERALWQPLENGALTARSFARLIGNVANTHGCAFHLRGPATYILLSRWFRRFTEIARRPPLSISSRTANAAVHATLEAIRNSERHAGRAHREISLRLHLFDPPGFTLRISDDGCGFSGDPQSYGLGIRHSLIARMTEVNGTARIESAPGEGCQVVVTGPLLSRSDPQPATAEAQHAAAPSDDITSADDAFAHYVKTRWGKIAALAIIPVLWLFTANTIEISHDPLSIAAVGLVLTLLGLVVCTRPWRHVGLPLGAAILAASITLPAATLAALPTFPHPSQATFTLPFLTFIHLWMWARGARISASVCFALACVSFAWASFHYGFIAPMPWDVIGRNIGTALFFASAYSVTEVVYRRIRRELDTQGILRAMRTASRRALAERQARVRTIDAEARELLTRLAQGEDPDLLRRTAAITEEQLRDFIRAAGLSVEPLREEVRAARIRGAKIRLVDDSRGHADLGGLIALATELISKANAGEEVTVRALPPGKEGNGTILLTSLGEEELLLV